MSGTVVGIPWKYSHVWLYLGTITNNCIVSKITDKSPCTKAMKCDSKMAEHLFDVCIKFDEVYLDTKHRQGSKNGIPEVSFQDKSEKFRLLTSISKVNN